jgi:hypothetical protein
MSTPQALTSQLADALIAGDQDAVISIMAQVIAYIADDIDDEADAASSDDTSLTKAARDGRPSTPPSSYLLPYPVLKAYASEHASRQANPASFDTIRRKELTPGVTALIGFKGDKSEIESIRFDSSKFTEEEARKWLTEHDFSDAKFEAASGVEKIGPGVNSVHVATAGDQVSDKVCDMCGKNPCECSNDNFIITKAGEEKRLAYGIVMRPEPFVDSQGDTCTIEEIEKMAHGFMMRPGDNQNFDLQHILDIEPGRVYCVESYIAPVDMILDSGKRIEKGSWIVVTKFVDEGLWQLAKSGAIKAYSIRGYGTRIPQ